jgi:DNA adenine methylase
MDPKRIFTPLRYPGGKGKFAPYIADLMCRNDLTNGHYLEPYAGGAAVALDLLFNGIAKHVHINDYDPAIYDFWVSVTKHPDEILKLLHDTPVNIDEWYRWRFVLNSRDNHTLIERGFATLFINRTNRSGILKAGVIGGKAQTGNYKLDSRFKKDVLSDRIKKIAENSSGISIYNEDALTLLRRAKKLLPAKSLIYLDPPYYLKGQGLYRNYYEHEDHENIAALIQSQSFNRHWVLSYDNTKEIKQMYRLSKTFAYNLNYSAQTNYVGSEVMFFSEGLIAKRSNLPNINKAA